jgi:hypothetical protein
MTPHRNTEYRIPNTEYRMMFLLDISSTVLYPTLHLGQPGGCVRIHGEKSGQGMHQGMEAHKEWSEGDGGAVGNKSGQGLYYAEDEDRERTMPKKDKEGKFHLEGLVQLASCKHARSLVDNCSSLWDLLADVKKVIGGLLARYFRIPCYELSRVWSARV